MPASLLRDEHGSSATLVTTDVKKFNPDKGFALTPSQNEVKQEVVAREELESRSPVRLGDAVKLVQGESFQAKQVEHANKLFEEVLEANKGPPAQ